MRPKGKLFALFAVFAAIGLVTATGAFTTVQADRTAQVNVAGDASALIALQPATGSNGDYARIDGNQLQLVFNSSAGGTETGDGINEDANTTIDNVFNVTNQGTQTVDISVSVSNNGTDINVGSGANQPYIYFYNASDESVDLTSGTTINNVETGENASIGVYIDSHGLEESDDLDLTVTINATAS
jgi:hypothetical protein